MFVKTPAILGDVPAQVVDYKYNARDWLTSINDGTVSDSTTGISDRFRVSLQYTSGAYQPDPGSASGYYNGNISRYVTRVSPETASDDSTQQSFAYDALDRLVGDRVARCLLWERWRITNPKLRHYDNRGTDRFVTFGCYRNQPFLNCDTANGRGGKTACRGELFFLPGDGSPSNKRSSIVATLHFPFAIIDAMRYIVSEVQLNCGRHTKCRTLEAT